ncbi:MAG: hypothetical protein ACRDEA_16895, partial [Microcystaceae cyanobacterium]
VEAELPRRKVPEFKTTLNQLDELIKAKSNASKIHSGYEAAIKAIDGAIAAIPDTKRQSPQFVMQVIDDLLDTAQEEYKAGVADGKVVELIEYQDSRGFVLYAENLYQGISAQLKQKNSEASAAISSSMTELKQAWPSVNPPEQATKTPVAVAKLIAGIQENFAKVSQ